MDARITEQEKAIALCTRDYVENAVPSIEKSYNAIESHGIKSKRKEATHTNDMKSLSSTIDSSECRGRNQVEQLQNQVKVLAKAFDDALSAYCEKRKVSLTDAITTINKEPSKHHYIRMVGTLLRDVHELTNGADWPFAKIPANTNQRLTASMAQHITHAFLKEKGLFGESAKKVNNAYLALSSLKEKAIEEISDLTGVRPRIRTPGT